MTSAAVLRASFAICCLSCLAWTPCGGQTVRQEELRRTVERYVALFNSGSASALAELYVERAEVASVGDGEIARGRGAVSDLIERVLARLGSLRLVVDSVTVMPLGNEAGLAFFRYRLEEIAGVPEYAGAMTLVLVRTPEGWRVAHDHASTLSGDGRDGARDAVRSGVVRGHEQGRVASRETPPGAAGSEGGPSTPVRETTGCTVTRIIDGDTIECDGVDRVRLIGIDAPERNQRPYGAMATRAATRMVPPGSRVELEEDVEPRDRYGRRLAYVWADGTMINWLLVREGWAVLLTYPPNVQYVEWFVAAQRQAREERLGLWEADGFDCLPLDHRRGRCD